MKFNICQLLESRKNKETEKKKPFVILNTDCNNGLYIRSITSVLKKYNLEEVDKLFQQKGIKNIRTGDIIVVGDCKSAFNYDYRVVPEGCNDQLLNLDGRKFIVYDSVRDYSTILNRVEEYANANIFNVAPAKQTFCCPLQQQKKRYVAPKQVVCRYANVAPKRRKKPVNVNINVNYDDVCPVFAAKNVTKYKRVSPVSSKEKVTFFDDYVKVGFNQFDIEHDCFQNSYIQDGHRNKYYISEDRYGRRFLVTK